jgi:hypothetical protein
VLVNRGPIDLSGFVPNKKMVLRSPFPLEKQNVKGKKGMQEGLESFRARGQNEAIRSVQKDEGKSAVESWRATKAEG